MTSIRAYLTTRLLAGFVVVLGLGSCLVHLVSARILQSDFDGRLFARAQAAVASTSLQGGRLDLDWKLLPQDENGTRWIEIIDKSGQRVEGDAFCSTGPLAATTQPVYRDALSFKGESLRVLALDFAPSLDEEDVKPATKPQAAIHYTLIVGSDRSALDHSLRVIAAVLAAMVVVTSVLSAIIVRLVLRGGLAPLQVVSAQVEQIDESNLARRIEPSHLPDEVRPIVEKLNDLLRRLQVSFARERQFNANVSHELRTPVAELRTMAEVMLQGETHAPPVQRAFEDAREIALKMEALVTTLLEMVRHETAGTPLVLTEVPLHALVQSTWQKREARAAERDIRLLLTPPDAAFTVRSESHLLELILANLLDNAIEYAPRNSTVEISIQRDAARVIISNPTENLTPADLPNVFEPFWRKDAVRGESSHFGLGLSLTRALCQRLGIALTVALEPNRLVRFSLQFPLDHPPANRSEAREPLA